MTKHWFMTYFIAKVLVLLSLSWRKSMRRVETRLLGQAIILCSKPQEKNSLGGE